MSYQINNTVVLDQSKALVNLNTGTFTGTNQITLPKGASMYRSNTPVEGMLRYSETLQHFEGYSNGNWEAVGDTQSSSSNVPTVSTMSGYILTTARSLGAPEWLEADGSVYLRNDYPNLASAATVASLPDSYQQNIYGALRGAATAVAVSRSGDMIVTGTGTNWLTVSLANNEVFSTATFGLSYPTTSTTIYIQGLDISPDGVYIATVASSLSHGGVWLWKRTGDVAFTRQANLPAITGTAVTPGIVRFSPDGTHLAVFGNNARFIVYRRDGDTFTKLPDPPLMSNAAPSVSYPLASYTPDSQYLVVGVSTTPFINIFKRSGDTYTRLTTNISTATSAINSVAVSPDNKYIFCGIGGAPFINVYERNGDAFTKLPTPTNRPSAAMFQYQPTVSPDGKYFLHGSAAGLVAYEIKNGDLIKLKYPDNTFSPDQWIGRTHDRMAFSKNGNMLVVAMSSQAATGYQSILTRSYNTSTHFRVPFYNYIQNNPSLLGTRSYVFTGGRSAPRSSTLTVVSTTTSLSLPGSVEVDKTLTLSSAPAAGDLIFVMTVMGYGLKDNIGYEVLKSRFITGDLYVHPVRLYYKVADGTEGSSIQFQGTDATAIVVRGVELKDVGEWNTSALNTITIDTSASTLPSDYTLILSANSTNQALTAPANFDQYKLGPSSSWYWMHAHVSQPGTASANPVVINKVASTAVTSIAITLW